MKERILLKLSHHISGLVGFQKQIKELTVSRIGGKDVKELGNTLSREWFDVIKPDLERLSFSSEILGLFSSNFEKLLEYTRTYTLRNSYLALLKQIIGFYKTKLIHQVEVGSFIPTDSLSVAPYIEGLPTEEGDYLDEAQRCLAVGGIRACIILGWCAAISRIHEKISQIGFEKFNKASEEMAAKQFGRFKPFNKKFKVESVSELRRTVFDTDLLWVLEYLSLIDSNQHERLRYCFEMRNNSAHPGQAPITGENLYSFYSDITNIVLKNMDFSL